MAVLHRFYCITKTCERIKYGGFREALDTRDNAKISYAGPLVVCFRYRSALREVTGLWLNIGKMVW